MKLTLKIKLLPNDAQFKSLKNTLIEANSACDYISEVSFKKRIFNQFKIHKETYHIVKESFNLSAQMVVRCISKVADSYKIDKKVKREFKPLGGIAYDSRILTYLKDTVSIWTVDGRLKGIKFICHNKNYLPYIKGEADLILNKGKFYLFQTVEIPDEEIKDVEEFIGVDFGLTDIAVTSDGKKHSAEWLNKYREKKQRIRSSIQSKGTKSSKRLLKRLSGREKTTATIINHTIAKSIVSSAKEQEKGISIEDLTNIRFTSKNRNKTFRTKLGKWNFSQLRSFLTYKCMINGVKIAIVNPRYTSQTCYCCKHIGKRTNKVFECTNTNCKVEKIDADYNASMIISLLGASVNKPESSTMFCSLHYIVSSKANSYLGNGIYSY
jgi:IS605 OrfB family transposase